MLPKVSVVMPVYGAELTVAEAVNSVLEQSFEDFELIIVDDGCKDSSIEICRSFTDSRIRIISQHNRGLSGARNTGIRAARGEFIALIDADDAWTPHKLQAHVIHLTASRDVGVSYAASSMIDDLGRSLPMSQQPRLGRLRPEHIFLRNPIGNGSAPVFRREVFREVGRPDPQHGEMAYFDESFRQSEDIECWMRIALTTRWQIEGIEGQYTQYRISAGGLSANILKQYETWEAMAEKVRSLDPAFHAKWFALSRAFQLRYLARRAVHSGDGGLALRLVLQSLVASPGILLREPRKTVVTTVAAAVFALGPDGFVRGLRNRFFGEAALS